MNDLVTTAETSATRELFIKMVIGSWDMYIARINKLFAELSDETLAMPVAPGRNTGAYLLGHLTGVHDAMLPILGLGERLYPQLESLYLTNPEKDGVSYPSTSELRAFWTAVNTKLSEQMATLSPEDWFTRHTLVPEADFAKEPHRNKLNLVINRSNHLNYHWGQLVFLKPRN